MRERLKKLIPPPLRRGLRVLQAVPRYLARRVRPGGAMIPPPWKNFVGAGDFTGIGREFLRHFVDIGGLRPEDRVLDVGCGIGRMAIPLTGFLRPPGEYHGFDIVPGGIEWCRARITTRHPHFHFHHLDVRNRHYNPSGTMTAEAVRFPFDDGRFDFVFLTSVFTHMLPPALETYVREIARMLHLDADAVTAWLREHDPASKPPFTFELPISREQIGLIRQGMRRVVGPGGTAWLTRLQHWDLMGKTGTAQNPHGEDHGWFVGIAGTPGEEPEIVVAMVVIHGEAGSQISGTPANAINFYLSRKHGLPFERYPTPRERSPRGLPIDWAWLTSPVVDYPVGGGEGAVAEQ